MQVLDVSFNTLGSLGPSATVIPTLVSDITKIKVIATSYLHKPDVNITQESPEKKK
jgi:hypothetical protein